MPITGAAAPRARAGAAGRRTTKRGRDEHGRFLPTGSGASASPRALKQAKSDEHPRASSLAAAAAAPAHAAAKSDHRAPAGQSDAAAGKGATGASHKAFVPTSGEAAHNHPSPRGHADEGGGHMPSGGEKHEGMQLCNGQCNCELECAENDALVSVLERIGQLLEAQGANRFSLRQMLNKDCCRVRKLTKPIDKDAVREIAEEKGMGREVRGSGSGPARTRSGTDAARSQDHLRVRGLCRERRTRSHAGAPRGGQEPRLVRPVAAGVGEQLTMRVAWSGVPATSRAPRGADAGAAPELSSPRDPAGRVRSDSGGVRTPDSGGSPGAATGEAVQ